MTATAVLFGISSATPAQASGVSYVWDDFSSQVSLYGLPAYVTVYQWSKNGTSFQMDCWLDNDGQRWAYGQIYDTGSYLYVPMWEVGNQITVGHC